MRVIAGTRGGTRLHPPPTPRTRPTTDRVKEAIFASLGAAGGCGDVLDLYAGSGQLGIEALSRGADHVDFVDSGRLACRTIARNLAHTRFDQSATTWRLPLPRALRVLADRDRGPYHLVLVDPPYEAPELDEVLQQLGAGPLVVETTWLAVEHTKRRQLADSYGVLGQVSSRRHGDNVYTLYRYRQPADAQEAPPPSHS